MCLNKINVSCFIFILLNVILQIQTLVELPIVEDNNIAAVETAIRSTVNNLFGAFKIAKVKHNSRLKQLSTIHNFFVSVTLKDCDSLREIARLTRVNNIDNGTQYFIAKINEVLNEDDKSYEISDGNIYVTRYIHMFIRKLQYLKDKYVSDDKSNIKLDILNILHKDKSPANNVIDDNILSDNEFWQPSGRRIYKGLQTSIKKFPFVASVHFFKKFQCSGSVIKDDLVITSASCLQIAWNNKFFRENPAFLSVQVGSEKYETGGENIAVLEIMFHPDYEPKYLKNNLAVMRLTRQISFRHSKKRVRKIDFDRNPWPLPVNSGKIIVLGWGAKDKNNIIADVRTNQLSYAELDHYPKIDCQEHYSQEFVTEKTFCAGFFTVGAGACNRDAGGPGIVDGILVGVISFGSPVCGARDSPTVFTKLGYYSDWIETIMEKKVPKQGHVTTTLSPHTEFKFTRATFRTLTPHFTPIMSTTTTFSPLKELRIADDDKFKDFLSTMFDSGEIDEYLNTVPKDVTRGIYDEIPAEESGDQEITSTVKQAVKTVSSKPTKKLTEPTTEATTQEEYRPDSDDEVSNVKEEAIPVKKPVRQVTVIEDDSDDQEIDAEIKALIESLDLDKVMKLENTSLAQPDTSENKQYNKNEKVAEKSASSSNEDNDKNSKSQSMNYFFMSGENQEEDEEGMSISTEAFKDLTFREKPGKNNTRQGLSVSSFAELISLAIDEEARRLKKKHYIL